MTRPRCDCSYCSARRPASARPLQPARRAEPFAKYDAAQTIQGETASPCTDGPMKVQLRIVAGQLRGRKLTFNISGKLRPAPQRLREALFSILGNAVPDRPFYDLFAGTGAVGLEAVSRGASRVTLVERDNRVADAIEEHAKQFGVAADTTVGRADVYRWAER